jgi:SAM-dependent methyltransferase
MTMLTAAAGMPVPSLLARAMLRGIRDVKALFGRESYLRTEDRRVLQQVIFPFYLEDVCCKDVLFVGCHWYTRGYNKVFERHKNYWTLEIDPARARYGAAQHIVDALQNLRRHFENESLDLILCNGVFGWGLDSKPDVERAFAACHECLRPGGVLIIGWDDVDERRPFPLTDCKSLQAFEPLLFSPLESSEYVTETPYRHTYTFYVKT